MLDPPFLLHVPLQQGAGIVRKASLKDDALSSVGAKPARPSICLPEADDEPAELAHALPPPSPGLDGCQVDRVDVDAGNRVQTPIMLALVGGALLGCFFPPSPPVLVHAPGLGLRSRGWRGRGAQCVRPPASMPLHGRDASAARKPAPTPRPGALISWDATPDFADYPRASSVLELGHPRQRHGVLGGAGLVSPAARRARHARTRHRRRGA